ncbi:MAG: hypothetical protein ACI4L1_00585 [Christensenellales bacterium]
MPKMFTNGFKPKSTTKKAKSIIRGEIKSYYAPCNCGYGRSALENMRADANSYSAGRGTTDWNKGKELVNAGCFACYYNDQRKMLSKIYGKKNVDKWDGDKVHNTYGNLIGREYASMLREKQRTRKPVKKRKYR